MNRWYPTGAKPAYGKRPAIGRLMPYAHEVYRVVAYREIDPDDYTDQERADAAHPFLGGEPYHLMVEKIADPEPRRHYGMRVPGRFREFYVYPQSGRWPQCSCCGEPMPCRAEMEDRAVTGAVEEMERHARKIPGCCWACGEPITSRQEAVVYAGVNLDAPGGPEVRFHTRRKCWPSAIHYEDRWRADDPTRPRILTYPACKATLIVHADGSSECFGGEEDCHGHLTHDHGSRAACYTQSHGCGRGCTQDGHHGCRPSPRTPRHQRAMS